MWPFATRGSRFLGDASDHHPSQLNPNDFARNDAVIKLWLPGRLLAAVDVLCDRHDASRPDVFRWLLFEHAYGRTEFAHLCRQAESSRQIAAEKEPDIRFSPQRDPLGTVRAANAHFLGKSTENVKLSLPQALKRELETLAERSGQPLSDYLRSMLARQLLGESHYLSWQAELARIQREAKTHEQK